MEDRELLVRKPPHKSGDDTHHENGDGTGPSMVTYRCPSGISDRIMAVPLPQVPARDDEDEQHDAEQRPKTVPQILQKLCSGNRPKGTIEQHPMQAQEVRANSIGMGKAVDRNVTRHPNERR